MSDVKKRWMSSGYLQTGEAGDVNREAGIIEGVSVVTAGEAKGHGVHLDEEFVDSIVEFGNAKKQGLKARFGHPNMCSTALGTFIGRFKNFRKVGNMAKADLFLSNEAKETPHGNLHDYVLGMATNESDMFGTSIVFTPGQSFRKDAEGNKVPVSEFDEPQEGLSEEIYVECSALHACDTVDEPAANEGLFSRFSNETIAGQVTEFLDLNPQVWEAVQSNPSIVESLARYGKNMDEFINRYREYREQNGEGLSMKTDESKSAESFEADEAAASEASEVVEETVAEVAEVIEEEKVVSDEATEEIVEEPKAEEVEVIDEVKEEKEEVAEDIAADSEEVVESLSREEFVKIKEEFGADIASKVMCEGGDYSVAVKFAYDAMKDERDALAEKVSEKASALFGTSVPAVDVPKKEKTGLFSTGK